MGIKEIVVSRKGRLTPIVRSWFYIICSLGCAYILYNDGLFAEGRLRLGLVVGGGMMLAVGVWQLSIIYSGLPLLETAPHGLMLCAKEGRCFVPWSNIKSISTIYPSRMPLRIKTPKLPDLWIKFEFHDSNALYYDKTMQRNASSFSKTDEYVLDLINYLDISSSDFVSRLEQRKALALQQDFEKVEVVQNDQ